MRIIVRIGELIVQLMTKGRKVSKRREAKRREEKKKADKERK